MCWMRLSFLLFSYIFKILLPKSRSIPITALAVTNVISDSINYLSMFVFKEKLASSWSREL